VNNEDEAVASQKQEGHNDDHIVNCAAYVGGSSANKEVKALVFKLVE
jgi:hypothetical protein